MSKYLRSFKNVEAYNQSTLDLPCVSLIKDGMSLMYDPKPNGPVGPKDNEIWYTTTDGENMI